MAEVADVFIDLISSGNPADAYTWETAFVMAGKNLLFDCICSPDEDELSYYCLDGFVDNFIRGLYYEPFHSPTLGCDVSIRDE